MKSYLSISSYENNREIIDRGFFNLEVYKKFIEKLSEKASIETFESELGNPIYSIKFGNGSKSLISFAGLHGNEVEGILGVLRMLDLLYEGVFDDKTEKISYIGVPILNIDSAGKKRRNAKGRDINRDFGKYGPFKLLGSEFQTKEAKIAKEIISKHNHLLVVDHHSYNGFDFFTEEYDNGNSLAKEIGEKIREGVREEKFGLEYVYFIYPTENKGYLVNYVSTLPDGHGIMIECASPFFHTLSDIVALEELYKNLFIKSE
ncbi:MAG: hypothetical protein QW051_01075 [Candidatus Aenigmatarchaeota archaeon]